MKIYPTISGQGDVFGLSNLLWGDLPLDMIFGRRQRDVGWGVFDDFTNYCLPVVPASSYGYPTSEGNQYRSFEVNNGGTTAQSIIPSSSNYVPPSGYPIITPMGSNNPMGPTNMLFSNPNSIPTPGQIAFTTVAANDQSQLARPRRCIDWNYRVVHALQHDASCQPYRQRQRVLRVPAKVWYGS